MLLSKNHLNHPFVASYLGMFTNDDFSSENNSAGVLEDTNLYYQPLQEPEVAIVFFIIKSLLIILGEYLHYKVLVLIKEENGITKNVAKLFVLTQMIFYPSQVIMMTLTDFIHPLSEIIGRWICTLYFFSSFFCAIIISSYSFIAALMRYFFILHQPKVQKIGKEKVKGFFLFFMIFNAILMTVWLGIENIETSKVSYMDKCYGIHHKSFLIKTSTLNSFSENKDNNLAIIKRISKILMFSVIIIMGLNISEGILYFRILHYMNR